MWVCGCVHMCVVVRVGVRVGRVCVVVRVGACVCVRECGSVRTFHESVCVSPAAGSCSHVCEVCGELCMCGCVCARVLPAQGMCVCVCPLPQAQIDSVVANVLWQMSIDRKIGALKQLQVRACVLCVCGCVCACGSVCVRRCVCFLCFRVFACIVA